MPWYQVRFHHGPCDGRERLLLFQHPPQHLFCGGQPYTNFPKHPAPPGAIGGPLDYTLSEFIDPYLPPVGVNVRNVLRSWRAWMYALAHGAVREREAAARAMVRMRRAVR